MPAPRFAEKDLLNADEMALLTLSQDSAALAQRTPEQMRDKIARAPSLRDRARDLYRRQVGRTRPVTSTKRGFSGMANERVKQKSDVLTAVVERLTQTRDQQIA